ncbi:MAG: ABC transporter permease [Planctomycetota bacterium]
MSLWKIAWRSIQQRGIASLLTAFSMSLGVMMVVSVLSIHGVVQKSFQSNASLGYNMIVGANKGGRLQLTLNTVYYLSSPVENIPYEYYLEFFGREDRDRDLQYSLRAAAHDERRALLELAQAATNGPGSWSEQVSEVVLQKSSERAATRQIELGRDGKFSQFTKLAIPVCLGDYFGPFRVVATTPDMFDRLQHGESGDKPYEFQAGRNFQTYSSEHGFFEAVIGATAAQAQNVKLGDQISTSHGDPEGAGHGQKFTVVGILKPSGTPHDRAVFINMEGFYLMEDHAKPIERDQEAEREVGGDEAQREANLRRARAAAEHEQQHGGKRPLPLEEREVTAILLQTANPSVAPGLQNVINEGLYAQAVLPIQEIYGLFELIVMPIQRLLLVLTTMICLVSGVSILVSIYNSMSDRRQEIAVMRALGASRGTVMTVILLESVLLSLMGGAIGWLSAHTLNWLAASKIESLTGVSIHFWDLAPSVDLLELLGVQSRMVIGISTEALVVPLLILLAVGAGFIPALSAYRTDVARSLSD